MNGTLPSRGIARAIGLCALASGLTACLADFWPNEERVCIPNDALPVLSPVGDDGIVLEATDRMIEVPLVDVQGTGSDRVSSIELSGGTGKIGLGCSSLDAAVYARQEAEDYTWFFGLAVARDRWYPFWLLCDGDELEWIRYEGTDGTPLTFEGASGSCGEGSTFQVRPVTFPAVEMPRPITRTGYTIDGTDISLSDAGTGRIFVNEREHELLLINDLACSEDCATLDWRNLHVLIWDATAKSASFAVLRTDGPEDPIRTISAITLPGFVDNVGTPEFTATFTKP